MTPIADEYFGIDQSPHSASVTHNSDFTAGRRESQGSNGSACLNGTFSKSPAKPTLDPLSGGDGLDVAFPTLGQETSASKLDGTFDKGKSSFDSQSPTNAADKKGSTPSSPKLNDTFDKNPSQETSQHNETFDKNSSIVGAAIAIDSAVTKTPELELRLDLTCQTEDDAERLRKDEPSLPGKGKGRASPNATLLHSTPEESDMASRNQSTPRPTRVLSQSFEREAEEAEDAGGVVEDEQKEQDEGECAKSEGHRRSSGGSFLKRRSSLLELSFVASSKRPNNQPKTPKGSLDTFSEGAYWNFCCQ